jgi:suppressor for copper-sensitivity B
VRPARALARAALLAAAALLLSGSLQAQLQRVQKATVELAADRTSYAPGDTVRAVAVVAVDPGWHVQAHVPSFDYLIPTVLRVTPPDGWQATEPRYPEPELARFGFSDQPLAVYQERFRIFFDLEVPAGAAAGRTTLGATLRYQACDDRQCLPPVERDAELTLEIGTAGSPAHQDLFAAGTTTTALSPPPPAVPALPAGPRRGLAAFLLLGVVGGLILNAMPCVLPILSLKVFGLVRSAAGGRAHVRVGALATAAGILVSFWALAGAAIGARAAGAAVGWGVQFQRPGFVAFLAAVILLFTLNLWGLFEIQLPGRLAAAAGGGERGGLAGHFASGLFATLMATPCSAPFLGTAVGFALAQDAVTVTAVFTAIGLGMALPYLALAAAPGAARFLPRPGAWMETLKGVMGFLLAGALVWLLYVLGNQIAPERLALVEGSLLAAALGLWLASRAALGSLRRRFWSAAGVAAAIGAIALAGAAGAAAPRATVTAGDPGHIAWRPWDPAEAERLAAAGTPVLLDITADWCVTCKVNERVILETPEVRAALAGGGFVAMRGDWTRRDDAIGAFLAAHGRYGIPFYMIYQPGREPVVLPELLTRDLVLSALADAAAPRGTPPAPAGRAPGGALD